MSSDLDQETRTLVIDAARDRHHRIICAGCGREVKPKGFQIDHRKPEIDGGDKYDPGNLQVLCVRKDGKGCHQIKTREEAKRRARSRRTLEVSPHKRATPWALLGTGLAATAYGYANLVYGENAADDMLVLVKAGTGVLLLLLIADNVVRSLRHRAPPEIPSESTAGAIPRPAGSAAVTARITDAMQDVIVKGDNGDITIYDVRLDTEGDLIGWTVGYAGTKFPDRNEDRCAEVLGQAATKMGGRWNIEWHTTEDFAVFTRRYEPPSKIPHPGFESSRPWFRIDIAPNASIDFMVTSHVLIAGATNSGKTSVIRAIIAALCDSASREECELILVDPKQIELLGFRNWPGVQKVLRTDEELWHFALDLLREMKERFRLVAEENIPLSRHKPIIAFIDEYKIFVERMTAYFASGHAPVKFRSGLKNPVLAAMDELFAMARKCGIHLVVATQSPYAGWFGGGNDGVRQNLEGRILVGRGDKEVSVMMFAHRAGGDIPASAKGRATVQTSDGPIVEAQTYWVPDPADSDPHYDNTPEDWAILARLGMPLAA